MDENNEPKKQATWCVLELMGHVRLAGRVTEEEMFGTKMGRIDVPQEDGTFVTRYFGGQAVYGMTPVTEAVARLVAKGTHPEPVLPWEFPRQIENRFDETESARQAANPTERCYDDDDEDDICDPERDREIPF